MSLWLKLAVAGLIGGLITVWQLEGVDQVRRWYASLVLMIYIGVLLRYGRRVRQNSGSGPARGDYLIAFATETGTARKLARQTQKWLQQNGAKALVTELNHIRRCPVPRHALLLVISTTGNGDPPKTGIQWLDEGDLPEQYSGCHYAVLALGDQAYPSFCGFGLEVAQWFRNFGATPLFDPVLVSQEDPQSIRYWFQQLEANELAE